MLLSHESLQFAFEGNLIDSPAWAVIPKGLPGGGAQSQGTDQNVHHTFVKHVLYISLQT
jgi:hypothetical protein